MRSKAQGLKKTGWDKKPAFLAAYAECGSIKRAAASVGLNRRRHYDWLQTSPGYRAKFEETKIYAAQAIEDEAVERAMVGVFEPNVFQGRFVYPQHEVEIEPAVRDRAGRIVTPARTERRDVQGAAPLGVWRKSDKLLALLLRGLMPEKYGMRGSLELAGPGHGPIEIVERLEAARRRAAELDGGLHIVARKPDEPG
jgi:hypothetical protein